MTEKLLLFCWSGRVPLDRPDRRRVGVFHRKQTGSDLVVNRKSLCSLNYFINPSYITFLHKQNITSGLVTTDPFVPLFPSPKFDDLLDVRGPVS